MQKSSHKKNYIIKIAAIVFEIIILLTAISIIASSVLGWFAVNNAVSGNGMGVGIEATGGLQIRASAAGEDISVTEISESMTTIEFPDMENKEIYPGVSGKVVFYVHDGSEGAQDAYAFHYRLTAKNDEYYSGDDKAVYPKGFYSGAREDDKTNALQYLSSHIMFFESYDGEKYSDWISPEDYASKQVESGGTAAPCEVTVYWIWVPNYPDIFSSPSTVLEESTRAEIASYYSEDNVSKIFNGEISQNGFDAADTLIGITIKYMCFEIEVAKI